MAPLQTEVADMQLLAAYFSFIYPEGMKGESAWLADLQRTVYLHKWSPFSCRSSAGRVSSSLVKDQRSTTVPRNQRLFKIVAEL